MNWQKKAAIMRLASQTPFHDRWYRWMQKKFGRLSARPMSRLPMQAEMVQWLLEQNFFVQGKTMFEVGTGHIPIVPIDFFSVWSRESYHGRSKQPTRLGTDQR